MTIILTNYKLKENITFYSTFHGKYFSPEFSTDPLKLWLSIKRTLGGTNLQRGAQDDFIINVILIY